MDGATSREWDNNENSKKRWKLNTAKSLDMQDFVQKVENVDDMYMWNNVMFVFGGNCKVEPVDTTTMELFEWSNNASKETGDNLFKWGSFD